MPTPTPHISAQSGDFAEAVLLPGDPLRARHIAEHHLDDAREVTAVRSMLGFTGSYKDMPVSVMGTGMGVPSASIYATELIAEYGVRRLVRVGSCGAVRGDVKLREIILAVGACTDSFVNRRRYGGDDFAAVADFWLLRAAARVADEQAIATRAGLVHTSDLFYDMRPEPFEAMRRMGVLAVEMEAAGLYGLAAERGARCLAILTVSDQIVTDEHLGSDERQTTFDGMVHLALEALLLDGHLSGRTD
ncbi:MAG: purine-nucleoside phosphorylase [bacterium]|nr:purine-nucleoside phosphorylase [bacterium]